MYFNNTYIYVTYTYKHVCVHIDCKQANTSFGDDNMHIRELSDTEGSTTALEQEDYASSLPILWGLHTT